MVFSKHDNVFANDTLRNLLLLVARIGSYALAQISSQTENLSSIKENEIWRSVILATGLPCESQKEGETERVGVDERKKDVFVHFGP
ncbi:hypothetical protein Plhal304r1_c011g0041621 [Plasmopara halstedii]